MNLSNFKFQINLGAALLLSAFSFPPSAVAQTYPNGVYADTNWNIAPGYWLSINQVSGLSSNALGTNLTYLTMFVPGTNSLATKAAAANLATSNALAQQLAYLGGTNNGAWNAYWNAFLGGFGNYFAMGVSNSAALGGHNNQAQGYSGTGFNDALILVGGISNLLQSPVEDSAIIGGIGNIAGYNFNSIVGGAHNWNYSFGNSAILGGETNQVAYSGFNNVILGGRSNYIAGVNNAQVAGVGANAQHGGVWIWADDQNGVPFTSTATNQFLIRAFGGVGINTNNPGTNSMSVRGNLNADLMSIGGTNLFLLFSFTAASNGLSILWNFNLNATSNGLYNLNTLTTNALAATIAGLNAQTNNLNAASNALQGQITGFVGMKAFTASLPATYASIGIGFNTPLMPDANYSVSLTPQDQNTAGAALGGMTWWISSKSASGFTIYAAYATNAFSLNFDCLVHENTQ